MNRTAPRPLTPTDRDRALARLRRLSLGAGISSLVAVGGIGYAAAASYAGKHITATSPVAAATGPITTASAGATASQSAATAAPTVQAAAAPTPAPTAAPVVTTGGS